MAGLNSLVSDTTSSTTTLPSWYDTAQQNVVSQATAAAGQMPQLQNTVAGGAIQNLSGANNPFFQAQGQLGQIASGAANPWITDTSGNVSPDTTTAMGGLFKAQQQELDRALPQITAPQQAGAVGSGNFGSLRGQTAIDVAKGDALAKLQASQLQAALQNQQTGVNAAQGLSNVGSQGTSTMTTLGQAQQAAPLTSVSDLAQILSSVKAPATVTQSAQLSPLSQLGSLGSFAGGTVSGLNSLVGKILPYQTDAQGNILKNAAGVPIASTIGSLLSSLFKSNPNTGDTSGQITPNTDILQQMQDQAAIEKSYLESGFKQDANGDWIAPAGWGETPANTDVNNSAGLDVVNQDTSVG